jgi:hypothetical protein
VGEKDFMKAVLATDLAARPGRNGGQVKTLDISPHFHAVGVLYAKDLGEKIELRMLYSKAAPEDIKQVVIKLFGIEAICWDTCQE